MAFEYYVREGSTLSIIMMDIDFFKQFNDYYGHEEGDRTLIAVANQINSIIEDPSEIIIRWGGEEFLYAAFNQSPEAIAQSADKIIKRVADLKIAHDDSSVNPYITISMGVGTIPITEQKDLHEAIDLADQALYLAKSSGRNCIKTLSIEDIEEFIFVS